MSAAPGSAPLPRGMITLAVMSATVMQIIDITIVNVSLPHMQGSLSATVDQISWVLTTYIVASAVMTPPTGWLSGRFGRRRLHLTAVATFTAASVACGLSRTLTQIVVFRLLQGAFGAVLVPLAQATLLDTYPRHRHGPAMAIFGMGLMVGPILGPTLGGYVTEVADWRWVFFINVPFGLLAFLLILIYVPDTERDPDRPFDFFGFAMLSLAVGSLQMLLDRGQLLDWFSSREIVTEAVLVGLGFYVFVVHSTTTARPYVDLRIFRDRNYTMGLIFAFIVGVVLLASTVLIPPFLQNLLGYPVLTTGLVLAPRGLGTMVGMMIVGRLVSRVDPRGLIVFGLVMIAWSLWVMTGFNLEVDTFRLVWTGIVQGFGLGFLFVPLTVITFVTLPQAQRTEGTGVYNLLRNLGSSIGISTVVTLLTRGIQVSHAHLAEHISPYNPVFRAIQARVGSEAETAAWLAGVNGEVTRQAAMIAYLNDFRFMMVVTLLSIPLIALLANPLRVTRDLPQQG